MYSLLRMYPFSLTSGTSLSLSHHPTSLSFHLSFSLFSSSLFFHPLSFLLSCFTFFTFFLCLPHSFAHLSFFPFSLPHLFILPSFFLSLSLLSLSLFIDSSYHPLSFTHLFPPSFTSSTSLCTFLLVLFLLFFFLSLSLLSSSPSSFLQSFLLLSLSSFNFSHISFTFSSSLFFQPLSPIFFDALLPSLSLLFPTPSLYL
ncbi:PTHR2 [Acanthosepion pharaonis]|uniref:PTHR2 n=1 Tax=Acanthosepion pharaonis TaxID=158019 RepID=A0A812ANY4_ACAPH|nr:PTHR2 [Sepia pharaonis]